MDDDTKADSKSPPSIESEPCPPAAAAATAAGFLAGEIFAWWPRSASLLAEILATLAFLASTLAHFFLVVKGGSAKCVQMCQCVETTFQKATMGSAFDRHSRAKRQ